MIYFVALPVIVIVAAMVSAVHQSLTVEFIDLHRVERVVLLAVTAWALGGWFLEARAGARAAALFETCASTTTRELRKLEDYFREVMEPF